MKNKFVFILCLFLVSGAAGAATVPVSKAPLTNVKPISELNKQAALAPAVPPTVSQPVDFALCTKFFKMDNQRLFYLTLAALNANRFAVDEIQTKSSYVLFTAAKKQFLASVISVDSQTSMLKITPCSNSYLFPVGIVQNMFKYIELNLNTTIQKLVVL